MEDQPHSAVPSATIDRAFSYEIPNPGRSKNYFARMVFFDIYLKPKFFYNQAVSNIAGNKDQLNLLPFTQRNIRRLELVASRMNYDDRHL